MNDIIFFIDKDIKIRVIQLSSLSRFEAWNFFLECFFLKNPFALHITFFIFGFRLNIFDFYNFYFMFSTENTWLFLFLLGFFHFFVVGGFCCLIRLLLVLFF